MNTPIILEWKEYSALGQLRNLEKKIPNIGTNNRLDVVPKSSQSWAEAMTSSQRNNIY